MRYGKLVFNGYIIGISNNFGVEITEAEYNVILDLIHNTPTAENGYGYRLKDDLTWELYELQPIHEKDEDATAVDYETALGRFGV